MIAGPLRMPVVVTLVVVLLAAGWAVWREAQARDKMASLSGSGITVPAVVVTLAFPPEAFHLHLAQQLGQLVRTDGAQLYLRAVNTVLLHDFARAYWVKRVAPWDDRS